MEPNHIEFMIVSRLSMRPNRIVEINLGSYNKLGFPPNSNIQKKRLTESVKRNSRCSIN